MSAHLQRELRGLKGRVLSLGARVEDAIDKAVEAMVKRDEALARSVIEADVEIDRREVEVEEECLKLLALYQPVAGDLRFIIAILKMNNDLERIGDYAVNLAQGAQRLIARDPVPLPPGIKEMAAKTKSMVRRSLDSLVNADAALALEICAEDDEIDAMRWNLAEQIKKEMSCSPERIEPLMTLFIASGTLERIADMATNIAEDVCYMVEGRIVRHSCPGKGD